MQEKIKTENKIGGFKTKTEGYSSTRLWAKRERKAGEAFARQSEYTLLSQAEKVKRVKSRRGESKRELARLTKKAK